ncbi:hypothetical protein DFH08DRAFT_995611 [Mycena albidolilacea]|uniref:Uncharacterized protein n=1 Tax=Mycena albidolilacea TaxID=1033008 RepID=A0AAD7A7K5_9AGAR|nr:hypothetical protein DFH08DRAFT_995611 [Mycena albidolilacea]
MTPSYLLAVPPEIWAQIATLSGRQAIARLSAASYDFYTVFASILYRNMTDKPPLHQMSTNLLVRTLRESHSSLKFNPRRLISRLTLPGSRYLPNELAQCLGALRNLIDAPWNEQFPGQVVRGAALRAITWDSSTGTDELADLLSTPGYFPNLRELSVDCGLDTRFDCFRVPNLEKLRCLLDFQGAGYDEWRHCWRRLRRAMAALSSSSPLLHSLSLTFDLHVYADSDDRHTNSRIPSWDIDADLKAAINQLQLPALTTFEFILYTSGFSVRNPAMDFSPMLRAHPLLTDITLNIEGNCVPRDVNTTFLSRLTSFTGTVKNCAAILPQAQALRHITMLFPGHAAYDIQNILPRTKGGEPAALSPSTLFTPARFPPRAFPGIVSLDARAVDLAGDDAHWARLVDPDALACLVAAFPNLVRLDVSGLVEPLHKYYAGLAALQALEHLGVRVHQHRKSTNTDNDDGNNDKTTFPPRDAITAEVNDGLRVLPALSSVRVLVWGDPAVVFIPKGCPSCNGYNEECIWTEYVFRRGGVGEFELELVREMRDEDQDDSDEDEQNDGE